MRPSRLALLVLGVAVLAALTARVSIAGSSEAADNVHGYLLVANKGARALSIIDPATNAEVGRVAENGVTGHEVTASPDGKTAYVPIYGDSGVGRPGTDGRKLVVIDIASRKVTGVVDFGKGVRPHDPAFNPKDGLLYVTTELDRSVTIVDPKSLEVVGSVPTGQEESHMLAISQDGRRGYTANVGPGTISVLDLEQRKTLAIIPVSKTTQRVTISPDDKFVFTADQTRPRLAMIDAATNKIARWIPLPAIGFGSAATHDGRWLVVAMPGANQVAIVDLKSFEVAHTIDVPAAPQEPVIRPDGKIAYVSCDRSRKVAAIRTSDWKVEALIDAGEGADGIAWAVASRGSQSTQR
jgi:DNA-binding beta-propeller fold protein YncE